MRIRGVKDVDAFVKVIGSCAGRVELVTDEGDRLNLKSKLAQYFSLEKILEDETFKELEIIAAEPEDVNKIISFLMD